MGTLDNCIVQALPLLSIARAIISSHSGEVLPLPGLEISDFLATSWDDLTAPLNVPDLGLQSGLALAQMFPPCNIETDKAQNCSELSRALVSCKTPANTAELVASTWHGSDKCVVFMSSGSTGTPKAAVHSSMMLLQELSAVTSLLSEVSRIVSLSPLQHCYGFMFGVLVPLALDLPRVSLPPLAGVVRENLLPNDLLAGFPDFWRSMPHAKFRPPDRVLCMSATAPWPQAEQAVLRLSGYQHSLEIFGSSENGVIGWRKDANEPFTLLPYWSASTQDAVGLYRYLPDGAKIFCPLQDNFNWVADNKFFPVGRFDHAVQVSGVNVYPAKIADIISVLPGVAACRVRLMRPEEGRRLKIFVVPAKGWSEEYLLATLKKYFYSKLSPPERPARISFGNELPKTVYGKDSDW